MDNIHPLIDVRLTPLNCSSSIHVRLKTTSSSSCHHSCLKWQTRVTQDVVYSQTNRFLNDRPTFGQHPINHLPPCSARGETDTSSSLLEPLWDGRKKEISHSWIRVCRVTIDLDAAMPRHLSNVWQCSGWKVSKHFSAKTFWKGYLLTKQLPGFLKCKIMIVGAF